MKNNIDITDYVYVNIPIENKNDIDQIIIIDGKYYWKRYLTKGDSLDRAIVSFILGYYHGQHNVIGTGSFDKAIKKSKLLKKLYL